MAMPAAESGSCDLDGYTAQFGLVCLTVERLRVERVLASWTTGPLGPDQILIAGRRPFACKADSRKEWHVSRAPE